MDEQYVTYIDLRHYSSSIWYSERETVVTSHLSLATLRHLRASGMVMGDEIDGELRYSQDEIIALRKIHRLQHDLGINLAGIEVIMHLLRRFDATHQQFEHEQHPTLNQDDKDAPAFTTQAEEGHEL